MKRIFFLLFCCFSLNNASGEGTVPADQGNLSIEINAGIMLGGEINRDNFTFKSGPVLHLNPAFHISDRWKAGLLFGLGITSDEVLLPLGAGMHFYFSESIPSFFVSMYGGYAEAWTRQEISDDYMLRGNWFIQPAFGYQLVLTDNVHGMAGIAFHHQRANLRYRDPAIDNLSVPIDWDYLQIRLGLVF